MVLGVRSWALGDYENEGSNSQFLDCYQDPPNSQRSRYGNPATKFVLLLIFN